MYTVYYKEKLSKKITSFSSQTATFSVYTLTCFYFTTDINTGINKLKFICI